jgi:hypothetical protein
MFGILWCAGTSSLALADGVPLTPEGRYDASRGGGSSIVLELTSDQIKYLKRKLIENYKSKPFVMGTELNLNSSQKAQIKKVKGFSPSALIVYDPRRDENTCTCPCHAVNIAYWFVDTELDVPDRFLMTDDEAKKCYEDVR